MFLVSLHQREDTSLFLLSSFLLLEDLSSLLRKLGKERGSGSGSTSLLHGIHGTGSLCCILFIRPPDSKDEEGGQTEEDNKKSTVTRIKKKEIAKKGNVALVMKSLSGNEDIQR